MCDIIRHSQPPRFCSEPGSLTVIQSEMLVPLCLLWPSRISPVMLTRIKNQCMPVPLSGPQMSRFERGIAPFMSAGEVSHTSSYRKGTEWWSCPSMDILVLLSGNSILETLHPEIISLAGHWQSSWQSSVIQHNMSSFIIFNFWCWGCLHVRTTVFLLRSI